MNDVEKDVARNFLAKIAVPVATETVGVGDKLAVGTGAALVLIISQLGDVTAYLSPKALFWSVAFATASLFFYCVARYFSLMAGVVAQIEPNLRESLSKLPDGLTPADLDRTKFLQAMIDVSVWPASWSMRFARWRNKQRPNGEATIRHSQRSGRFIALQVLTVFIAIFILFGNFSVTATSTPTKSAQSSTEAPRTASTAKGQALEPSKLATPSQPSPEAPRATAPASEQAVKK